MAARVGDYLKQDPLKIRFTSSNPQNSAPKQIIKRALNQSVADITGTNYYSAPPNVVIYYELLDISIVELETKKSLKVVWTGSNNKEEVRFRARILLIAEHLPILVAQNEYIQRCCGEPSQSGQAFGEWKWEDSNL